MVMVSFCRRRVLFLFGFSGLAALLLSVQYTVKNALTVSSCFFDTGEGKMDLIFASNHTYYYSLICVSIQRPHPHKIQMNKED